MQLLNRAWSDKSSLLSFLNLSVNLSLHVTNTQCVKGNTKQKEHLQREIHVKLKMYLVFFMAREEVNSLVFCELSYFWVTSDLQSHARIWRSLLKVRSVMYGGIPGGYIWTRETMRRISNRHEYLQWWQRDVKTHQNIQCDMPSVTTTSLTNTFALLLKAACCRLSYWSSGYSAKLLEGSVGGAVRRWGGIL